MVAVVVLWLAGIAMGAGGAYAWLSVSLINARDANRDARAVIDEVTAKLKRTSELLEEQYERMDRYLARPTRRDPAVDGVRSVIANLGPGEIR